MNIIHLEPQTCQNKGVVFTWLALLSFIIFYGNLYYSIEYGALLYPNRKGLGYVAAIFYSAFGRFASNKVPNHFLIGIAEANSQIS